MSFVPLEGVATFTRAHPPRDSAVGFSGTRHSISLPMKGAIPVLSRGLRAADAHPSVSLLSAATLLGLQLVAAGRVRRTEADDGWRIGPLDAGDEGRVRSLAAARAYEDLAVEAAEQIVRDVLDAVADTMTRQRPSSVVEARPDRAAKPRPWELGKRADPEEDLPHKVVLSLRVEAAEELLAAGGVAVVLQVHEAENTGHVIDAEQLWLGAGHGFSPRARLAASVALRQAAELWTPLDRLLRQRVPDRLELTGEELADLIEEGVAALGRQGIDVYWPAGLRQELTARGQLEVKGRTQENPLVEGLFSPSGLFEFDWRLALAGDPLTDEEMKQLAEATTPVIRLRDNWIVVDPGTLRRARRRKARELKPVDALRATLTGELQVDGTPVEVHPGAYLEKVRDRITDATTVVPFDSPPGLAAELRDYQRVGFTWLAQLTGIGLGACLADDMGLGKTVQVIALHLHRRARGLSSGPTLVVCPASLLGNWEAEVRRFAPGVPTRRHHGGARDLSGLGDGFVFTTYGTMRRDHELLGTVPWDLVVADEAQHIKNPLSSTARNLRTIGSRCGVALTGTPVENDLTELWAILDWTTPGLLGSRNAFRKVWAAPIESGVDPAVARRFAQLVGPFLLRRRKTDPGIAPELPPKTETDRWVELTREQVVLYEALVRESLRRIEEAEETERRGLVLALLTGLKQICNHPAHYLRQQHGRLRGRSGKLEALDELLGTILSEGGRVLLFTQYVAMARLLERHLAEQGIATLFLYGGTPVPERERMVAAFQAGEVPVFLLSLKAAGTGLNLTRADHVVHVDRWWNPAVEDQATDRAHRIGQQRPVQVHRLVSIGTIEERIAELLMRKRSLAEAVLGDGEAALTELSDAELRELVTLRRGRD